MVCLLDVSLILTVYDCNFVDFRKLSPSSFELLFTTRSAAVTLSDLTFAMPLVTSVGHSLALTSRTSSDLRLPELPPRFWSLPFSIAKSTVAVLHRPHSKRTSDG